MAGTRVRCPKCSGTIKVPGVRPTGNDDDDWLSLDQSPAAARPVQAEQPKSTKPPAPSRPTGSSQPEIPTVPVTPVPPEPPQPEILSEQDITEGEVEDEFKVKLPAPKNNPGNDLFDGVDMGDLAVPPSRPSAPQDLPDLSEADLAAMQLPGAEKPTSEQVDGLFPTPEELSPEVVPEDVPTEYRFKCPTCHTLHYAKPNQSGRQIKCTDCHSAIVIPPPPKIKPKYNPSLENAPTFQLQKPVDRSAQAEQMLEKNAAQLLQEAEDAQLDEDLDNLYNNPDVSGWLHEVFGIFAEPGAGISFCGLSILFAVVAFVITWTQENGMAMFFAIGLPAGILALGALAACGFAIVQSTIEQESRVKDWPFLDPGNWGGRAAIALAAVIVSAAPGCALGLAFEPFTLLWAALVLFSVYVLFPIVLLSMIEHDSFMSVYSQEVVATFSRCRDQWGGLYLGSGVLFFSYFLIIVVLPIAQIAGVALVAVGFIYFRLLGRVAFATGQSIDRAGMN